ncbi:MAG: hypothetical protein LBJ59_03250 [Zoogloeaceae bacterium]|jgi:hypothetical protein|nr:hypothetical protein [Zoogloeaceae bacterium]
MRVSPLPLFLPLKTEFFNAFAAGEKSVEYRRYGARWNEQTCVPGRRVTLSCGYGTMRRLSGVITEFEVRALSEVAVAQHLYAPPCEIACIHIKVAHG